MHQIKTISLDASDITWDEVDKRTHNIGFNNRSQYIQYLVERDMHHKRLGDVRLIEVSSLLLLAVLTVIVILWR